MSRMGLSNLEVARQNGYWTGVYAGSKEECPYTDKRTSKGGVTWSRAYRNAWMEGWKKGYAERNETKEG